MTALEINPPLPIDPWILSFSALTVLVTVWMGFWSARKSRTASDFFVAGRSVSVGWNASAISGEYLSAASFMGVAGMVMSSGYDALWYPVCYACGYLFLLLFIAGPLRRFGAYTIPDFAEGRFDSPLFRKIAVVFVLFIGFFYTMPQMKGAGTTLSYIFPGLPYWAGVVLVGAVITLNVALGGMKGITLVQAFQYWAKMFAISVPVFVLAAVYGHYGKQVGANEVQPPAPRGTNAPITPAEAASVQVPGSIEALRTALQQPDFGMFFLDFSKVLTAPTNTLSLENVKFQLHEWTGRRDANLGKTESIGNLVANYSAVARKRVSFGQSWRAVTNAVAYDDSQPKTRRETLALMEAILRTNGGFVFPLNDTNVILLTHADLAQLRTAGPPAASADTARKPIPAKAPADNTWINPFGPLTTKAVAAANAASRWNLSSENRAELVDWQGNPPPNRWEAMLDSAERLVEGRSNPRKKTSQFADWTNMPVNSSRSIGGGGFPLLSTLNEYGLLLERPVFVATNLPRQKLPLSGSFQTRDAFLAYLETLLRTNGVRLETRGDSIKAVTTEDWDRYQKDPATVPLVPNRLYSMRIGPHEAKRPDGSVVTEHVEPRILIHELGDITGKLVLRSPRLPTNGVNFNPDFKVMLAHEAQAGMETALKEAGVSVIPANDKEIWAVPTAELSRYQGKPLDPRPYSLLYTYSLIIALVCGTAGLPHILVRFYTNPDGVAAKRTTMWVMILIGVFYLFPPVFGVMGRNLMPDLYNGLAGVKGTDGIVLKLPKLLNERFGVLGSILSGVTCAGAFAAFMSTFSGLLVSMTGALAHDVYGRMLRPKSTPDDRMKMFKLCAVIVGAGAMLLGFLVESFEINKMVGWAFAIAATSYFPLLFLSTWWRGITMKGAASGMLVGGTLSLLAIASTMFADQAPWAADLKTWYAVHPLCRILAEQPAIWGLPLALALMFLVSRLTAQDVPPDIRMKMLVLHAPEKLGLKQEYIQEHQH